MSACIQEQRAAWGVFMMSNHVLIVLFFQIIFRSVTTMFDILEHSYLFSIVLVILIFSLKGSSYIWFSVKMHVSVYLENECMHLLLELIVPMLLDGCSGSSSSEKASFVWYSSWSWTSWSCCGFFFNACLQYLHWADLAWHWFFYWWFLPYP